MKKYKCKVSLNQCTNAKKYALTEYEKSIDEHYSMLRSYGKTILDSNHGSTDSPNQCEILTAIGRDGNNHIYPVVWAVVNVKNKDNWTWFLELLEEDLGYSRGNGLTLMSDQHKKPYPGLEYRQLFWAASKASYPQLFNKIMDKIKSANPNAHKYLMDKNPKTWSRAFFEVDRGCEAIENGFSGCFNRKLVGNETLGYWHVIHAGGNLYEVRSRSEGFTIDEGKRTCSCRMWQLSGLPCVHATKIIFLINRVPESYVPTWFETDMYFVAYHNYVKPVPGMNFWLDQSMYSTVLPPKPRKMPGRPRKKRIRAIGEGGSSTRVSKVGSHGSCSNCKKPGHNKSSCKEHVVEQTPKPKRVVGRPIKKQPVGDFKEVDVVQRGPVIDEGASGTREGVIGPRGRGCTVGSRGGANGSIGREAGGTGGASVSRGRGAVGLSECASGSIGRGAGWSKKKPVSTAGTQKRQGKKILETSGFAKWFGLQDEPEQTQAAPQQTQHEPK
ncbi:multidrug resistance-associated protein 5 [Tanacetum coccineum]